MTKTAAMPVYGKALQKSSLEPVDETWYVALWTRANHRKFVQMMTLG